MESLSRTTSALDASDTGTGKTYTALGVAREVGKPTLVICPKSVKSTWRRTAIDLGVELLDVVNIEQLKTGKTPYLKRVSKSKWVWKMERGSLVIYDEVQSASGYKSQNSKILALTKAYGLQVLMLSATVADTPLKLRAVGYLLGLHKWHDHFTWCLKHGCYRNNWNGVDFVKGEHRLVYLNTIHRSIFPEHGTRIRIDDLDGFPENSVFAEAYDLDGYTEETNEIYARMDDELANLDSNQSALTVMLRARQRTELLKTPLLNDMTRDLLLEEKSVVVFVSFKETLECLSAMLKDCGHRQVVIRGGQKEDERDEAIAMFQADKARICLAMIQAGGVGVSLHDLHGNHPRVSLITPTFNSVQLKQALGRIPRAGGMSKCLQRILFAAGTVEDDACKAVRRKLDNLSMLNDGDLAEGILSAEKVSLISTS